MESGGGGSSNNNNSNNGGLGKLLPKAMVKRRRKLKGGRESDATGGDEDRGRRTFSREMSVESDDGNSLNLADDDDIDGRSFGSYESGGADPDQESEIRSRPHPIRSATIISQPSQSSLRSPIRPTSKRGFRSPFGSRENLLETAPVLEPPAKAASPDKFSSVPPRISTIPPRTPPTDDQGAPVIVNTPPTPPQRAHVHLSASPERKTQRNVSGPASNGDGGAPSQTMSGHRRTKSGSASAGPSKLSNITLAPLSPTPENGEATPSSAGFFSSMFSAAQNAASTISNNIQGTTIGIGGTNKNRTNSFKQQAPPTLNLIDVETSISEPLIDDTMDKKESAVRTLGSGELSLSQLGISDNTPSLISPEISRFPDLLDTRARSESAPADSQTRSPDFDPEESTSRPRSLYDTPEQNPNESQTDLADSKVDVQQSPSGRSDSKPRRKRGSSVATTATVAIGAVVNPPGTPAGAPKLTGFAIASKKRNRDFHMLFKSVPDDDYLIEDYSCALQREILAHGRLYVSEGHLCFSSNILGWTTTLVMSFDEIVSVEKRSTALVFKNGLMISTLHAKHIFASFTSRDATYDLIVNIWKLGHPTLKSTLNGVRLEGTGGDKTEKIDAEPSNLETETQAGSDSEEDSDEDEEDDFYDEEDSEEPSEVQPSNTNGLEQGDRAGGRKVSGTAVANGTQLDAAKDDPSAAGGAGSFPGPATHAPTDCGDSATHYEKVVGDEIIPAPLGKVYSLIFGPQSPAWMGNWITVEQKCLELQMEDKKGLSLENPTRELSYIKPLYASIGPRQTKCMVTETLDSLDLEKAVSVSMKTQNPDVPSGNIFCVKTKYCLSWAENNATRVQVNCVTEWSGKSWLRGPIEKNVNEGQGQYCKDLFAALKAAVSSRPRASTTGNGPSKGKKKGKKGKAQQSSVDTTAAGAKSKDSTDADWGLLEPIRGIAEPIVDLVKPLLTGNIVYGLLVGLLVAAWFRFGFTPNKGASTAGPDIGMYSPYRHVAYDEMWRREESELWDWLEERVGLERLSADGANVRKKIAEPRTYEERLREERMDKREVEEAIKVTEEKLKVLREVMARSGQNGGR
ncbi:putative membrane protein C20F10.07 [Cladobotryum mycophilum]|uniref:Membrane protein C20F10.07 n=1 Tax=Cladobotryum mycophilum TaxID=491253 RepID=A0ABR0T1T3_9HYPO